MKWEYLMVTAGGERNTREEQEKVCTTFLEVGQDGWELVSVSDGVAYFKRSIFDPNNLHLPEGAQYMGDITDKITFGVEVRNEDS